MDGKEYYFDITKDYDFIELIEYWEEKINLDQQSIRPKPDLDFVLKTDILLNNADKKNLIVNNYNLSNQNPLILDTNKIKQNNLLMILDTETTDFAGDIIQLGYIIIDLNKPNNNQIIKSSNKLVKNRIPSINSTKIHNITVEQLRNDGIDFYNLIEEFVKDLEQVKKIIGHNISFDLRIIINNLRKFGINICDNNFKPITNLFEHFDIECTRKLSKGKSLENLHIELFGKQIPGAHDALIDVLATFQCYLELMKNQNNLITKSQNQMDLFV